MKTMSKKELRQHAIPESDMYEHEMIRPETKAMRALRVGLLSILAIGIICATVILAIEMRPFIYFIDFVRFSFLFFTTSYMVYSMVVRSYFVRPYAIKLAITEKGLLISFPDYSGRSLIPYRTTLVQKFHEIVDVSIRNPRSPELKCIMEEGGVRNKFKYPNNVNLSFANLVNPRYRSSYKYLIRNSGYYVKQPFSDDVQFVDIGLQGGHRILVECDDAENFVNVLKRRIPQRVYNLGRVIY